MSAAPPASQDAEVLIVGAGFSGTLLAVNILRHDGPRVTLVERRPDQLGRGVAYSAADDSHLLNVRAGNMSAFPDDPDHFVRWLGEHGGGDARSFVRRTVYGNYLSELLAAAARAAGDRLHLVQSEVTAIRREGGRLVAEHADGHKATFDRAVLALGNLPPHAPPGIDVDALSPDVYCQDPWAGGIVDGLSDDDEVLLLGSGLTAIDAALLLDRRGFRGRITAMSRRGLHPRGHDDAQPPPTPRDQVPSRNLSALVHDVRLHARTAGWRGAVDALRPVTQLMWSGASPEVRQRFLRHLRPFWDVHRHRLAPAVATRIERLVDEGRLTFIAGKLEGATVVNGGVDVARRLRGRSDVARVHYRRIVNCTGPQGDLTRTREPLLRQLHDAGVIRPDAARLGIDIDAATNAIGRDGAPDPQFHVIGPMTRGAYWEVVAVPDIRVQCWRLARRMSNAHWIGEGL